MKKQVITLLILMVIGTQFTVYFGYKKAEASNATVIPDEAIRLRILANSDSSADQALKRKVRDEVKEQIDGWVQDLTSFKEARQVIQDHLPEIERTVAQTLKKEGSNQTFTVKFGKHIKFPTKMYGNFIYPAGEYEAVLVTLGKGEGANWWCVLFPPLCFLDFSNGDAVKKERPKAVKAKEGKKEVKATEEPKETVTVDKALEGKASPAVSASVNKKKITAVAFAQEKRVFEGIDKQSTAKNTVEKKQTVQVVEEEEPEVKLLIVEVFSSLFKK
ncbi:stage II sporulation protein R [Bacillus sp. 165]|uniref:stage II sporulation protein R n=1 Tax=Bacillus sp. 165 TaxID=1529117 RepID=UPI001ADC390E|nr:stage II sporulation protein R [Bacillus sp. 165]MBO9130086.1 stage II sporulation protein R [Bacillus sp. 165]